jgi:tyrosinase
MSGPNIPTDDHLEEDGFPYPPASFTDYFNDGGDVTTLNHTLWMVDIIANTTIGEVMDLNGDVICAEYVE